MTHVRTQIRDAVVAALTGLSTTGSRVYAGRSRPAAKDTDPFLLVYGTQETSEPAAIGVDPILMHELMVRVEGRALASTAAAIENTLDQIALEVEPAITRNSALGHLTRSVILVGTRIAVESPGERHAGEVTMEFRIVYRTRESSPHAPA